MSKQIPSAHPDLDDAVIVSRSDEDPDLVDMRVQAVKTEADAISFQIEEPRVETVDDSTVNLHFDGLTEHEFRVVAREVSPLLHDDSMSDALVNIDLHAEDDS